MSELFGCPSATAASSSRISSTSSARFPWRLAAVGGGFIPDGDLTGSFVQGTMRLSTDTSAAANPSFQRIFGAGGAISIEFTKTDEMWAHTTGTNEVRFASGLKFHSSGESTSSSASAKGKVIAWDLPLFPPSPFAFVNAQLGQNHTVQILVAH